MMEFLLHTPLLLLLLALALRLAPLRVDRDEPWNTPLDVTMALLLGLGTAVVKAWWLALFVMMEGTDTSDMSDICSTVEGLRYLDITSVKRQPVAALLPAVLSHPLGFFDGLCASALLSAAGMGAALYLWARTLHSRAAGVATVLFSCAFTPLVVMTRYLTFYPECIAAYALCAASVAAALRWRTRATLGLAGAGVGLALAVDHMGLVFALVPLTVAFVVALRPPAREQQQQSRRRRILLRVGILAAPVLVSWVGARLVTPETMNTFEDKAIMFTVDNVGYDPMRPEVHYSGKNQYAAQRKRLYNMLVNSPPGTKRHGYNWGRAGPVGMVRALLTLALLSQEKPADDLQSDKVLRTSLSASRASQITPWLPVALASLALTCLALWRRRWELLGLLAVLAPFAVILKTVSETQVFPKYLMAPVMPIPVLMGIAWVTLANRPAGEKKPGWLTRAAVPALHLVVIGVLVTGLVPSWIAPTTSWRMKHATNEGFYRLHKTDARADSVRPDTPCTRLFLEDVKAGLPPEGRLYPQDRFKRRFSDQNERRPTGDPPIRDPSGAPPFLDRRPRRPSAPLPERQGPQAPRKRGGKGGGG